jgi:hypothetical protein
MDDHEISGKPFYACQNPSTRSKSQTIKNQKSLSNQIGWQYSFHLREKSCCLGYWRSSPPMIWVSQTIQITELRFKTNV